MQESELAERIAAFPHWHYEIELQGLKTPVRDPKWTNRHRQRRDYMIPPLVEAAGGSLQGKRVLDLGCNAGFWALEMLAHGADFVLGIDGRQLHVDQAELVFEAREIDPARYHFMEGDVFKFDPDEHGRFDIVLCLGLLYHVSHPMRLIELTAAARELALIDTTVARTRKSILVVEEDIPLDDPRSAINRRLVMNPSARAIHMMAEAAGFQRVTELRPAFSDYTGAEDYKKGRRRAFIASK